MPGCTTHSGSSSPPSSLPSRVLLELPSLLHQGPKHTNKFWMWILFVFFGFNVCILTVWNNQVVKGKAKWSQWCSKRLSDGARGLWGWDLCSPSLDGLWAHDSVKSPRTSPEPSDGLSNYRALALKRLVVPLGEVYSSSCQGRTRQLWTKRPHGFLSSAVPDSLPWTPFTGYLNLGLLDCSF